MINLFKAKKTSTMDANIYNILFSFKIDDKAISVGMFINKKLWVLDTIKTPHSKKASNQYENLVEAGEHTYKWLAESKVFKCLFDINGFAHKKNMNIDGMGIDVLISKSYFTPNIDLWVGFYISHFVANFKYDLPFLYRQLKIHYKEDFIQPGSDNREHLANEYLRKQLADTYKISTFNESLCLLNALKFMGKILE